MTCIAHACACSVKSVEKLLLLKGVDLCTEGQRIFDVIQKNGRRYLSICIQAKTGGPEEGAIFAKSDGHDFTSAVL